MSGDDQTYSAAAEVAQVATRRTWSQNAWRTLKKAPLTAWFGLVVVSGLRMIAAIFAPMLAPYGESQIVSDIPNAPWSAGVLVWHRPAWP
jgi:peptide/nickel transport system permease protein